MRSKSKFVICFNPTNVTGYAGIGARKYASAGLTLCHFTNDVIGRGICERFPAASERVSLHDDVRTLKLRDRFTGSPHCDVNWRVIQPQPLVCGDRTRDAIIVRLLSYE